MSRPTKVVIDPAALLHNVAQVRHHAPGKQIIAMVKANAYGCGVRVVAPLLEGHVDGFGVACLEEALAIRDLGCKTPCILFQGVFSPDELRIVSEHQWACVLHQKEQLSWLLNTPLDKPIRIWIKVNTGMNRLGFDPDEISEVRHALAQCSWVHPDIGLMSHCSCADEPSRVENKNQISLFNSIDKAGFKSCSMANSAAILALPDAHYDVVRPGIMLYGVSPFASQQAQELGLVPVMRFQSSITAIHDCAQGEPIGYSGLWRTSRPSKIAIVAVGYGDGYPRHVAPNTPVWIAGREAPIVGRISMDMMTVDLTEHPGAQIGDLVELWGIHIPVERIAQAAGTIAYELLCQITKRPTLG